MAQSIRASGTMAPSRHAAPGRVLPPSHKMMPVDSRSRVPAGVACLGLALLLGSLAGCSRLVEDYCATRLAPDQHRISVVPVRYSLSQSLDSAALSSRSEHGPLETTMGLTTARSHSQIDVRLRGMKVPGGVCVRADVDVQLSYAPMTVYIARELEPGSCGYREVLAHEMRHVAVFRQYLDTSSTHLDAVLRARLPASQVFRFASMDDAARHFKEDQEGWLASTAEQTLDAVADEQKQIDTPAEYQRLSRACAAGTR